MDNKNLKPAEKPAEDQSIFREVVSEEIAEEEVTRWLDRKRVVPWKRDKYKDQRKTLISAVQYGNLEVAENGILKQKLQFPVKDEDGGIALDALKYEPRVRVETLNKGLKGVDSDDDDGRALAYVCALTGKSKGMVKKLMLEDYSISQSIAVFFM